MTIKAEDHYRLAQHEVTKTSELASAFESLAERAEARNCDAYWRGQANEAWGITSSLSRSLPSDLVTDKHLRDVEHAISHEARQWLGSTTTAGGLRSNLEWLALLQHHWVPTRLIDFSTDPFIATFFAVESHDDVDGRIFCVMIPRDTARLDGSTDIDINDIPAGTVKLFEPRAEISPRLAAQHGVFLLGKLPSTQTERKIWDEHLGCERQMLKDEVTSVMSLPFYFRPLDRKPRSTSTALESYTIRIHVNKASVRRELNKEPGRRSLKPTEPVNHRLCYPDVAGMLRYSRVWRDHLGVERPDAPSNT